jgi:hypothetical protein
MKWNMLAFWKPKALAAFVERMIWFHRKKCLKVAFGNLGTCDVQAGKWKRKKKNNSTVLNRLRSLQSKC